jgi:large subunit ribosomal protein L23
VGLDLSHREVLIAPVVSEKSYSLIADDKYCFKVHPQARRLQIRQAVEALFEVEVTAVNVMKVPAKPKRRGFHAGRRPGWKKAIVTLKEGEKIDIFEGGSV